MDKEVLFAARLPQDTIDVPGLGTVTVRGLSRAEVLILRKATDDEGVDGPRALTLERKMLATALVDPQLTEAEVGRWQAAAPAGELEPVTRLVQQLSGMLEDAPKSGVPEATREPGAGVRVLPGGGAVDDGGGAAAADVR